MMRYTNPYTLLIFYFHQQLCFDTDQSRVARCLFIATATTPEKASQASNTSALSTLLTVSNHYDGSVCDLVLLSIQHTDQRKMLKYCNSTARTTAQNDNENQSISQHTLLLIHYYTQRYFIKCTAQLPKCVVYFTN